jgi:hypothetical protein
LSKDSKENDEWVDIYDWLGTESPVGSPKAVKELLRALIDSNAFYCMSEVDLQSILGR